MPNHHPSLAVREAYDSLTLPPGAIRIVEFHFSVCPGCAGQAARTDWTYSKTDSVDGWPTNLRRPKERDWRWAGPGLSVCPLPSSAGIGEHLYLFKARGAASLPSHGHDGIELVAVLSGEFTDGPQHFAYGDVSEKDELDWHAPKGGFRGSCICLVSSDGPLRLQGVARWLQPLLGV